MKKLPTTITRNTQKIVSAIKRRLGFAIRKEIVENHDGAIMVFSKPNKGSTFKTILPTVK